jgi:hypothetical protein
LFARPSIILGMQPNFPHCGRIRNTPIKVSKSKEFNLALSVWLVKLSKF